MEKEIKYSLQQWCENNNRQDILDRWDYELNGVSPDQVSAPTKIKRYLKCPRGIHKSELYDIEYLCRDPRYKAGCRACNSFAQHIIDKHGEEYLNYIWSDKNEKSPWDYTHGSNKEAWFNCVDNPDHVYPQVIFNRTKDCLCPYCDNHNVSTGIAEGHSLAEVHPESIDVWSDKNEKTPYDFTPSSGLYAWWKCENGIHEDFKRKICNSNSRGFKCPICAQKNKHIPRGEEHPNWKGTTPEVKAARMSMEYKEWRKAVYERDGYVCQICLNKENDDLRAHHIRSFARNEELRYELINGITTCKYCHDNQYKGSFHQLYGTINNTPEQLQEYAERRRAELGITEPFNIYDYMTSGFTPTPSSIPFPEELPPDLDPVTNVA